MIGALLPGLREARTPTIVGLGYALIASVFLPERLLDAVSESLAWNRLRAFLGPWGQPISLMILAVAMYLLGSILTVKGRRIYPFPPPPVRAAVQQHPTFEDVRELWKSRWFRLRNAEPDERVALTTSFIYRKVRELVERRSPFRRECLALLRGTVIRGKPDRNSILQSWINAKLTPLFNQGLIPSVIRESPVIPQELKDHVEGRLAPCAGMVDLSLEGDQLEAAETEAIWEATANYVHGAIQDEFGTLVTRAQVEAGEVFNAYDRQRAEGELRLSLALCVSLFCALAVVNLSPWWLIGLAFVCWLWVSGTRHNYEAEMKIWDLLTSGVIESPTIHTLSSVKLDPEQAKYRYRDYR